MNDNQKLDLCRKYFYMGFACLPFLWLVNSVWFFSQAFGKQDFPTRKPIRNYVIYSMTGAFVWAVAIIAWVTTFQLKRVDWESTGDYLSFNIPRGIP